MFKKLFSIILVLSLLAGLCGQAAASYTDGEDAKLLAEVEAKKQAILSSKTDVTYTGAAYYVSNTGDDANSGTSPEQAWATTDRVNAAKHDGTLQSGDAVFFNRGNLFRGWIDCAIGVTYSAYGAGEKPKIYGSSEDGAGEEKWELWYDQNGVKIWKYYRDMTEVGNIVFDDGDSYATRIYSYYNGQSWVVSGANQKPFDAAENLKDDLTFYSTYDLTRAEFERYAAQMGGTAWADMIHKAGPLYLRCDAGNPGELYREIEFHQMPEDMDGYLGLVTPAGNNVIDNLCIRYYMANGIAIYGADNESSDNNNNVIQNCEVGWHGGTQHDLNRSTGDVMVCGEAIVFKTDYNVFRNNYVHQAAQGVFVCEFTEGEWLPSTSAVGNVIEGNVIEHSPYCFWFWDNGGSHLGEEYVFFKDTTIRGNYVMYMGYGWYNEDKCQYQESVVKSSEGENLSFAFNANGTSAVRNMNVTGNVFYRADPGALIMAYHPGNITFSGNTYVQEDNREIIAHDVLKDCQTVEEIKTRIAEVLGDTTAKVFSPSAKQPVGFTDVPSDAYYAAPVAWAVEQDVTTGYPGNRFAPGETCTRAQIITFIWRAAGKPSPKTTANPFTDVDPGQYYYEAALWAHEQGIDEGSTTFRPNDPCTRAEAVTFLWKNAGSPADSPAPTFTDVSTTDDFADAAAWAVQAGVTTGYPDNRFAPKETCTRGQIVTFLYRAVA